MRALFRTAATIGSGLALVAAAGCGQGMGGGEAPPQQPDALASLDACSILTPDQATAAGVKPQGAPDTQFSSEPGCAYRGSDVDVTTYKNMTTTVEAETGKPVYARFDKVDVNGRSGAVTVAQGSTRARICSTMFDAGKGMVRVSVRTKHPGDNSFCEKSQEVAKQIEPRMPKKQ